MHHRILAAGLAGAAALHAADSPPAEPYRYWDVRVGWATTTSPTVKDDLYLWDGTGERGTRLQVSAMRGSSVEYRQDRWAGWIWGVGVAYQHNDITPQSYDKGRYAASSDQLSAHHVFAEAIGGVQVGVSPHRGLKAFAELTPFVGAGGTMIETSFAPNRIESGTGLAFEYGAKFGVYLAERGFLLGGTASFIRTRGDADITIAGGGVSTVTVDSSGVAWGVDLGYRF